MSSSSQRPPSSFRLLSRFKRAGVHWLGDNELGVVFEMERFKGFCGPGHVLLNSTKQRIGSVISLAPDGFTSWYSDLVTREGLRMELAMSVLYTFDPRRAADKEMLPFLVRLDGDMRQLLVSERAQSALLKSVRQHGSEQMCNGSAVDAVEKQFKEALSVEIEPLGFVLVRAAVQGIRPPPELQARYRELVERAANVRDVGTHDPQALRRALQVGLFEDLPNMVVGKMYINPSDLQVSMGNEVSRDADPGRLVDPGPTAFTDELIIDGEIIEPDDDEASR